jgi:LSD1 subclass zinc finger protein
VARTAVVYRSQASGILIVPISLHPPGYVPCDVHRALLHCPPGSSQVKSSGTDSVQIAQTGPTHRCS